MEKPLPPSLAAALVQEAIGHGVRGSFAEAIALLTRAVGLEPAFADAHYNLGVACRSADQTSAALTAFEQAVSLKPDWPEAHFNLGNCYQDMGCTPQAIRCFEAALRQRPHYPKALNNLASLLLEQGASRRADELLQRAVRLQPNYPQALYNLARVCRKQRRLPEALGYVERAVRLRPALPLYGILMADLLSSLGRVQESRDLLARLLKRHPQEQDAIAKIASLLCKQGDDAAALAVLDRAIADGVAPTAMLKRRVGILQKLRRWDDAHQEIVRLLEINPDHPAGWKLKGIACLERCDVDGAINAFERSLVLSPGDVQIHCALATALCLARRFTESRQVLDQVLLLQPDFLPARMNLAMLALSDGDFAEGWREFEWRLLADQGRPPKISVPDWKGEPLRNKTILLRAEQGLGDTFQFIRFAREFSSQGAQVVVECQKSACELISRAPGVQQVIAQGEPLPPIDFQLPLLSIAGRLKTTLSTLPCQVPYLFAEPARVAGWQKRLRPLGKIVVGIAWQGNRCYRGDQFRSMPLAHFRALAEVPRVSLVSLQKHEGVEQLKGELGFQVHHFTDELDVDGPFRDTAAIVRACDLIVSSDTALVHLAGAMAVPTWVALGYSAEWRWLREGMTSPWYPTMRLYRQTRINDWPGVFRQMAGDLTAALFHDHTSLLPPAPWLTPPPVLNIAISPGDLIDKFLILSLKQQRLVDEAQQRYVQVELDSIRSASAACLSGSTHDLGRLVEELRLVNERLWVIEEELRKCEYAQDFGPRFVSLARSVYQTNDQRASIKRQINVLLASPLREEKSFQSV